MASVNPFFGPNSSDTPWVDQISKTLQTQLRIAIDTPPVSIFEIPKTLKAEKLEAYTPQWIGLGPYHHFQSELYHKMEQNKLSAMKRVLRPHQIHNCQQQVVEKIREIIPIICGSYDLFLDTDDYTLAWLFAIDGLFLLDQLDAYFNHGFVIEARDLIMLENQIPVIVLKEIHKAVWAENALAQEDDLESKFRFFCESHSPFLFSKEKINFIGVNHLLDYMYHSIVNNKTSISCKVNFKNPRSGPYERDAKLELLEVVIKFAGLIPGAKPFLQITEFNKKKENTFVEEIKVPSVSELHNIARVKFRLSPRNGGIKNIKFVLEKEWICYLPLITLNIDSEVLLRNLVAYEKLMAKNSFVSRYGLELTEYVDFLCGIIDTVKDVRLLREDNIIEGDLGDEEVVELFNGIGRSHGKMSVESELGKTVAQINMVYESMPIVCVQRLAEKQLRVSAKIITFLISIWSILILIREVYSRVCGFNPTHMMLLVRFLRTKLSHFRN